MKRKLIVVIIAFNSDMARVHETLHSFQGQVDGVIITDNSPNPEIRGSLKALEREYPGFVTYVGNNENMGIGAALNIGAREAIRQGADWVMTIEDDNAPEPGMVETMFAAYEALSPEEKEKVASIAPNYTRLNGFAFPIGDPVFMDGAITSGEIVKASAYPIIGWYNEYLFMDFVDGEFACRMWQHGLQTLVVPRAILTHRLGFPTMRVILGKTIRIPNYPPYRYYFMMRNAWFLYVRNFKTYILNNNHWQDARWSILFPRFLIKAIIFEKKKGKKLLMAWRGFCDGIRGKMDRAYARERAGLPNVRPLG